ncbi:MAG: DUF4190 domain-containing protein [Armatimonadota bacterium]|nr:DUF4190 domain-containing protein [Armatimonadota bacterium]
MSKEQQILMLGILSLVCCSVLGPFAWLQANEALSLIDHGGYSPVERNLVAAGQVCGMIGTGLLVLEVLVVLARLASGTR